MILARIGRTALIVATALLADCADPRPTELVPSATPCGGSIVCWVAVTPATATLRAGDTLRVVAVTGPSATLPVHWAWTSSDTVRVRVDSTGLVRAVGTPTPGTAVCATMRENAGLKGCMTIVVQAR